MKISKSGYKKNSKDKNEPALVIPSNEITMENVQFPVLGISDTGDVRIMNPGEEHVFNGNYVYELPIAQDGGTSPGPSKVIGGKIEISYDKDDNIYLRAINSPNWTKLDGDRAKEFKTKFAKYIPGYFDPAGSIKKAWTEASKQVTNKVNEKTEPEKYNQNSLKKTPLKKSNNYYDILNNVSETLVKDNTDVSINVPDFNKIKTAQKIKELNDYERNIQKIRNRQSKTILKNAPKNFTDQLNDIADSFYNKIDDSKQYYEDVKEGIQSKLEEYGFSEPSKEGDLKSFDQPKPVNNSSNNDYYIKPTKIFEDNNADYGEPNNKFWGYRYQDINDNGLNYSISPRREKLTNKSKFSNVLGVAHFLIESDLTDGYISKGSQFRINKDLKNNQYVPFAKKDKNGNVNIKYAKGQNEYQKLTQDGYKTFTPLRTLNLNDIDWSKSSRPYHSEQDAQKDNYQRSGKGMFAKGIQNILTKDGKDTWMMFKESTGKGTKMGKFNGNSLVFIIETPNGRVIRDFAGTVDSIEKEANSLVKEFNVDPSNITLGFYDAGSYSAKPMANKEKEIYFNQYSGFNVKDPLSGASLMIPGNLKNGGVTAPGRFRNPEGNWLSKYSNGGDISIPDLSNKGWLSKYQDAGPVQRDPNILMYPSVSGESDTFDAAYSLPTVNVTPKWTEAELERNRLRDDYIEKDKNAFRHWYDKLGYDRRNVDKRAMQYAYNKLAKEYLKGDRDKLTDEQKKFIGKSEYAARLQPTVGERFVEGVTNPGFNWETLGNIAAPLEYPTNLVRGAVKGEFTDAVKGYTPSPYFVSSDLAGTSPTEAAIMSGIIDAGVDSGLGAIGELNLADDAARATQKANNFLLSKQGVFYKPKLGTLPVDITPEQIRRLAEIDEASSINAYTHRPNDINLTYEEINNIGEYRKNEAIKRFLERSRYLNEEEVVQIFGKTKQEILNYKPNIPTNSSAPINPSSPITTMMDRILRFGDPQIERAFTDILTSSNRFQAEEAINTISSPMWRDRLREYAATYYPEMNQVDNSAQNINQVLSPPETIYVDLNSNNITDGYQSGSYAAQRAAEELPPPPPELNSLFSTNNVENIYDTYRRSSNDIFSTRPQNNLSANWQNTPSSWANFYTQQQPLSLTGELRKIPKNIKGLFNAAAKNPDHIATPSLYAMSYSTPKEMLIDVTDKLNKSVLDAKPGEIITGSTNTSYNSYLVQMDYVAKNAGKGDLSEPIFLGYKPMNDSGFLSNMGVPNEEIIQYINNNLNKIQTRKGVNFNFGNNAPYIGKDGNIMIPHFGLRKITPQGEFSGIKKKHGGWVDKYQDGGVKSQVEPDGRKMAENLKRIWNLSQPSFTRLSSYDEYTPKFGWSRGSMTPEERAYEQEYLRQKYSPIPYLYIDPYELQTIDYLQNLLFSKPKKKGGVKSSGEGYYDYINGYSGIFAKGGNVSKENNWLNKYK